MHSSSTRSPVTHGMFYLKPAAWQWGRCLRAALCIGGPFALGLYLGDIMPWMWVAMGTLMMTTGERPIAYQERIAALLASALFGAAGYLLGYLSLLPYGYTIAAMACVGFLASRLSRLGPNWSIGCLQLLLTASIAIGVPSIEHFWWPAILYLAGALVYVLVLCIEIIGMRLAKRATPPTHNPPQAAPAASAALALAACLALAYAAKYFIHTSHWFWVPLTVGLIMKPDLGNVVHRSILRCVGTAIGVMVASAILAFFPKDLWIAVFIAVLAGILPWCMARSYALQAVALTPLILLLIDTIVPGLHNVNDSLQRLVDTLIGAAIVVVLWLIVSVASKKTSRTV